jgi:hypothetical protein
MDRYYQCHKNFDLWQTEGKQLGRAQPGFVCRIKAGTSKTVIKTNAVNPQSFIFYDAIVLLGTPGVNQTKKPVRLIGYRVNAINYSGCRFKNFHIILSMLRAAQHVLQSSKINQAFIFRNLWIHISHNLPAQKHFNQYHAPVSPPSTYPVFNTAPNLSMLCNENTRAISIAAFAAPRRMIVVNFQLRFIHP